MIISTNKDLNLVKQRRVNKSHQIHNCLPHFRHPAVTNNFHLAEIRKNNKPAQIRSTAIVRKSVIDEVVRSKTNGKRKPSSSNQIFGLLNRSAHPILTLDGLNPEIRVGRQRDLMLQRPSKSAPSSFYSYNYTQLSYGCSKPVLMTTAVALFYFVTNVESTRISKLHHNNRKDLQIITHSSRLQ